MEIKKTYRLLQEGDEFIIGQYGIEYQVLDNNQPIKAFKVKADFFEGNTQWLNINQITNEDFLKENNIEYIVEGKEKNIIPIGLVDFIETYGAKLKLNVIHNDGKDLYIANQKMKNIERAIQLKFEALKFVRKFTGEEGTDKDIDYEKIELV